MKLKVLKKTSLGKAVNYALDQWDALARYVDDGRLAIDNNIVERAVKAFVIGRKNWLFSDSVEGMRANAIMYTLVQTARANGLDPFEYLTYVYERLPNMTTAKEVESLLPWNVRLALENEKKTLLAA
jgi:hypothetical protein